MRDKTFISIIVGAILIGIAAFIVVSVMGWGGSVRPDIPSVDIPDNSATSRGSKTTVTEEDNSIQVVRYTGTQFIPAEVSLDPDKGGCLVTIANDSTKELLVRLGPHNPDGVDPGFQYDSIKPGELQTIDPRFRIDEIAFHDHLKPDIEFFVNLGPLCRL